MNDRLVVPSLAALAALGLWLAPWAAVNRETGSRSTLLLLPDRVVDFTGRTDAVLVSGMPLVLTLSIIALAVLAGSLFLGHRARRVAWIAGGVLLLAATVWGLGSFAGAVDDARKAAVLTTISSTVEAGTGNRDFAALQQILDGAEDMSLNEVTAASEAAGLLIRRLPYANTGPALAAFLALVTGVAGILWGLTIIPAFARQAERFMRSAAIPAISILLAVLISGVVILILQPTPMGAGIEPANFGQWLTGRLDTVWYAFVTLFAGSLTTFPGFLEALKFSTPLIFTGLALAFGFRAGQFNIGASGQMTLGGIFAMLVGLYLPGPAWIVLPAAIIAAALGGGIWGFIPGYLKARFGASEVINTIMMNYIAASLMLFLLSSNLTFAAPALAALRFMGWFLLAMALLMLIPPFRRVAGLRPRVSVVLVLVLMTGGMVYAGLPHQGEPVVTLQMPFKAPGSEPKSYTLREEARVPQLPALLGINLRESPGMNVITRDLSWVIAPAAALLAFFLLPHRRFRGWPLRLGVAVAVGGLAWLACILTGLNRTTLAIPPTTLNLSFVIAIVAAVFMQYLMWRTHWGYDLRASGDAPKAAEYGGASISRNIIGAMVVSGAFAGLTATHYVLGGALEDFALRQTLPVNDGFDGIAVALLGANTPLGVVLAAFLFGVLKNGGAALNVAFSTLTRDVVSMILALVVLFIAARGFLPQSWLTRARVKAEVLEQLEPEEAEAGK